MTVWDEGTYVPSSPTPSSPSSSRAAAPRAAALFQTDGRNWMIHRMDPPADPDRRHPPERYELIQPPPGPRPRGRAKGGRSRATGPACVACCCRATASSTSWRRDGTVTPQFPEVRTVGRALGATEVALDGVITAAGAGRPPGAAPGRRVRFHPAALGPRRARVVRGVRPAVAGRPSRLGPWLAPPPAPRTWPWRDRPGRHRRPLPGTSPPCWRPPPEPAWRSWWPSARARRTTPDRPGPVAHPHPRRLGDEGLGLVIAHRASELELQRAHVAEGPHDRQPRGGELMGPSPACAVPSTHVCVHRRTGCPMYRTGPLRAVIPSPPSPSSVRTVGRGAHHALRLAPPGARSRRRPP